MESTVGICCDLAHERIPMSFTVRESDQEMKNRRLNVVTVTPDDTAQWRKLAVDIAYPKLRGAFVPADYFDDVIRLSKEALAAPVKKN